MTLLRRVIRQLRPVVETVLAGALLGVVAMGLASQFSTDNSPATREVPVARAYMLALIHNDLDTMQQLGPSADTIGTALNFQSHSDALKNLRVDSLTYVGGSALGQFGVHVYVVQTEDPSGQHLVPFSLTVYQGHVVRVTGE